MSSFRKTTYKNSQVICDKVIEEEKDNVDIKEVHVVIDQRQPNDEEEVEDVACMGRIKFHLSINETKLLTKKSHVDMLKTVVISPIQFDCCD